MGLAALKLGAGEVFGTDLDESAIRAVEENRKTNGIEPDRFLVARGNLLDDKAIQEQVGFEKYDIAVANILADVIILLQKQIPAHLKSGGIFIASGIINTKEEAVRKAIAENEAFEEAEVTYQGEWVCITARKKGKEG